MTKIKANAVGHFRKTFAIAKPIEAEIPLKIATKAPANSRAALAMVFVNLLAIALFLASCSDNRSKGALSKIVTDEERANGKIVFDGSVIGVTGGQDPTTLGIQQAVNGAQGGQSGAAGGSQSGGTGGGSGGGAPGSQQQGGAIIVNSGELLCHRLARAFDTPEEAYRALEEILKDERDAADLLTIQFIVTLPDGTQVVLTSEERLTILLSRLDKAAVNGSLSPDVCERLATVLNDKRVSSGQLPGSPDQCGASQNSAQQGVSVVCEPGDQSTQAGGSGTSSGGQAQAVVGEGAMSGATNGGEGSEPGAQATGGGSGGPDMSGLAGIGSGGWTGVGGAVPGGSSGGAPGGPVVTPKPLRPIANSTWRDKWRRLAMPIPPRVPPKPPIPGSIGTIALKSQAVNGSKSVAISWHGLKSVTALKGAILPNPGPNAGGAAIPPEPFSRVNLPADSVLASVVSVDRLPTSVQTSVTRGMASRDPKSLLIVVSRSATGALSGKVIHPLTGQSAPIGAAEVSAAAAVAKLK